MQGRCCHRHIVRGYIGGLRVSALDPMADLMLGFVQTGYIVP